MLERISSLARGRPGGDSLIKSCREERGMTMNCFECASGGKTVAAVSFCPHCGIGLCPEHPRAAQA